MRARKSTAGQPASSYVPIDPNLINETWELLSKHIERGAGGPAVASMLCTVRFAETLCWTWRGRPSDEQPPLDRETIARVIPELKQAHAWLLEQAESGATAVNKKGS